ncbi:hypothetical protein WJ95_13470 [Burkholderia ubonensis]|nr:hypothetical protein WJ95_13470 [Burkholderia ubonensis]
MSPPLNLDEWRLFIKDDFQGIKQAWRDRMLFAWQSDIQPELFGRAMAKCLGQGERLSQRLSLKKLGQSLVFPPKPLVILPQHIDVQPGLGVQICSRIVRRLIVDSFPQFGSEVSRTGPAVLTDPGRDVRLQMPIILDSLSAGAAE